MMLGNSNTGLIANFTTLVGSSYPNVTISLTDSIEISSVTCFLLFENGSVFVSRKYIFELSEPALGKTARISPFRPNSAGL